MYNENYTNYEQLMKIMACDKGQALVKRLMNQLM